MATTTTTHLTGHGHNSFQTDQQPARDASEPGGRLGPFVDNGQPDLRNLALFYEECDADDVLLLCTDGVHENLDPARLGVAPAALAPAFAGLSWEQAAARDPARCTLAHAMFAEKRLETLLEQQLPRMAAMAAAAAASSSSSSSSSSTQPPQTPTEAGTSAAHGTAPRALPAPEEIVTAVTDYCLRVTAPRRHFAEAHPREPCPGDAAAFPGRLDHTTCVAIRLRFPAAQLAPAAPEALALVQSCCPAPTSTAAGGTDD